MKISLNILTIAFVLSLFFSCDKKEDNLFFYWNQTGCADPWNTSSNDSDIETIQAVENYLSLESIDAESIKIEFDESLTEACEACSCLTGNQIYVEVDDKYKDAMLELNFVEK